MNIRRVCAVVAALSLAGCAAVCAVAIVDHTHKHHERVAARRDAWFCQHRGTRCGRGDPVAIEAAWNDRERWYVGGAVALGVIATVAGGLVVRRPRVV
jgi:hypothetical protein